MDPRKKLFKISDNIPFDIQLEIIKKVYDVKSLIQFRSVSKPWKAFIDNSEFIKGYGARDTQPRSHILNYKIDYYYNWNDEEYYIFVVDDDIETFKLQELAPFVMSPLLKQYRNPSVVGACHGLLCWCGYNNVYEKDMFVIWNPSIQKSFGVAAPKYRHDLPIGYTSLYGFGVCPLTSDPTVIRVLWIDFMPTHAEVFTLSSGVWDVIPSGNLPRQSIKFNSSSHVVIDRFIYWGACEKIGIGTPKAMVVSFDLITKEFNVVDLPDSLTKNLVSPVSVSKLRESLVVYGYIYVIGNGSHCGVWVMEHDSSFKKLYSIYEEVKIAGFKENGETLVHRDKEGNTTVDVYDPCSQQIKNLRISGKQEGSFFMGSYKESLLLLDHPDLHIYFDDR